MRFLTSLIVAAACVFALPAAAKKAPARAPLAARAALPSATDPQNLWLLDLSTGGRVTVWLRPDVAPNMVERIRTLTRQRFYDGLVFHRVIDDFMAQGGDPSGNGTGGSTLPDMKAEFNYLPHARGAVAAARADADDSANSQFYIVLMPKLGLDQKYTVFGRVISGMQYADAIQRGEPPTNPTRIVHAYIAADNPPAYQNAPAPLAAPALTPTVVAPVKVAPKPVKQGK
ncbi:MAG: peptidylprolyl isomerase [Pseudomonadota bacterium]